MKHLISVYWVIAVFSLANILQSGDLRIQSSDLSIAKGSDITIDGKLVGTAPCEIPLKTNVRHKIQIESRSGSARPFYITAKILKNSQLVDNIPTWFFNPSIAQQEFQNYRRLTPGTIVSASIADAVSKAETEARKKMRTVAVNQYNTIRESDNRSRLDSSQSQYYPKLTRGQMDSLNDVNGGMMVTHSFGESDRVEFLEYEIQKVDNKFQVYVLAGEKK